MKVLTKQDHRPAPATVGGNPSIKELVKNAADVISPVWPLKTFIAVNPLQGLENLPFEQAVAKATKQIAAVSDGVEGRESVNRELIKWCSTYFDEGQATIPMPVGDSGFYDAFRILAPFDARLSQHVGATKLLENLPESPEVAIRECLDDLAISLEQTEEFIRQSLAALPGWSGYVKWKEQWQNPPQNAKRRATLVEYVAVRLILTRILWPEAQVNLSSTAPLPSFLSELPVAEQQFRKELLGQLVPNAQNMTRDQSSRPDAQLVFCIDVRSEPFRRAIEAQGHYQTLGFAGFFGLPVQVKNFDDDHPHDSCPVLLKPSMTICEEAVDSTDACCLAQHDRGRSILKAPASFYEWLKYNFATPFALVEMLGPWLGLKMMARTFIPSRLSAWSESVRNQLMPKVPTEPKLAGMTLNQQSDFGESALRLMGLTENLAPFIVLCGHGSTTTNNAYGSALDCGACGGNPGGGNARILAAILNNSSVREMLAQRGLPIPGDTVFVAAEHDTTTDHVELFQSQSLTEHHQQRLERLAADLANARLLNTASRTRTFGLTMRNNELAVQETVRRSADWAEVRPEWGLAKNAAFIVGPRELTQSIDLKGRCFLHSYDWKADQTGKFLTTILTAPMVVAQWINSQYLFSTLNNVAYGAGSKVTQNVTGKLGMMQGNASDLMHGLSLQSVYSADGERYHEPLRLSTVVYAPRSSISDIIAAQDVLQKLFGHGWVTMVCIDPADNNAYVLNRQLQWEVAP